MEATQPTKRKQSDSQSDAQKKKKKKNQKNKKPISALTSNNNNSNKNAKPNTTPKAEKKEEKKNASKTSYGKPNVTQNEKYGKVDVDFSNYKDYRDGWEIANDEDIIDSNERARLFFEWMIAPVTVEEFYEHYWEKKALFIKRKQPNYYHDWFSKKEIDQLLREKHMIYSKNLDITLYENGARQTLNPEGRAKAEEVWNFYDKRGCSVRMLHPQQYSKGVSKMLTILEDFWQCGGGCNSYLTPAGSQGFAPHYDDVEAFVLQLEGAKHWRLYSPIEESEFLARESSRNYRQNEIGKPFLEVDVECGDFLYFPRGTIHQAVSLKHTHSLHITLSTALRTSWANFLEVALPLGVQAAFEEDIDFRKSLPRDFFTEMGVMRADSQSLRRKEYVGNFFALLEKLLNNIPIDVAADQMALGFIEGRMPPLVVPSTTNIVASSEVVDKSAKKITTKTYLTMVNSMAARLVIENDLAVIYTPVRNRSDIHNNKEVSADDIKEEDVVLEFPLEASTAIEHVIGTYPVAFRVSSIPLEKDEEKIEFAERLFNHGILMIRTDVEDERALGNKN